MERAELPPVFLCARYRHHRHMKSVLILYSGQSGHTRAMCDAAVAGAATQSADVTVRCLYAPDAGLDDLLWADALLLGTPENFGYMSGLLKDFFDRTYYPAAGTAVGLPYAVLISSGNDGRGAARAIGRIDRESGGAGKSG